MKNLLLSLIFILVAGIATAQEPGTPPPMPPHPNCPHMNKSCITDKKHEIGVSIANLMLWPRNIYPWYPYPYMDILYYPYPTYYAKPSLGLNYRNHNANGAYRAGLVLNYAQDKNTYAYGESESSDFNTSLSSGYEWHNNFRKLQLFYGVDLSVSYAQAKNSSSDTSSNNSYSSESVHLGYGINPLVGIKYYLSPSVSIGTETQFKIGYWQTDFNSKNNGIPYSTGSNGFEIGVSPLGLLSLGIHF